MPDETPPPGFWQNLLGFLKQWQVFVTAVGAATALWFGFAEQRRTELELNREAVLAAREPASIATFRGDPHNTLIEFQATFPDHAYCAALGTFIAEAGRQRIAAFDGSGTAVTQGELNRIRDAVAARIERLLDLAGADRERMQAAVAEAAAPGDGEGFDRCAFLTVPLSPVWRLAVSQDCRRTLQTYAQTECQVRAAELRRDRMDAQLARYAAPDRPIVLDPEAEAPDMLVPEPAGRQPDAMAPPSAACGDPPPTIFIQFVGDGDRSEVEALQTMMTAAGWRVPGIEQVPRGRTAGDVRYYHAAQKACADELAAAMARLTGADFTVISLEGSYRNLPQNQLELWLPPLG
jgi:hypothetical protein